MIEYEWNVEECGSVDAVRSVLHGLDHEWELEKIMPLRRVDWDDMGVGYSYDIVLVVLKREKSAAERSQ